MSDLLVFALLVVCLALLIALGRLSRDVVRLSLALQQLAEALDRKEAPD